MKGGEGECLTCHFYDCRRTKIEYVAPESFDNIFSGHKTCMGKLTTLPKVVGTRCSIV